VIRDADSLRWIPGSEDRELSLPLRETLATGEYSVEWRTAGADGHAVRGRYTFSVEWVPQDTTEATPADSLQAGPDSGAMARPDTTPPDSLTMIGGAGPGEGVTPSGRFGVGSLARSLLYLLMAGALGGAVFRFAVLRRVARTPEFGSAVEGAGRRLTALVWLVAAGGLVALPVLLGLQSIQVFGEGGLAIGSLYRVVTSPWGQAWGLEGLGVLALLLGLSLAHRGMRGGGWTLAGLAGLAVMLGSVLAGHARAQGPTTVVIFTLHGAAAAIWAGGLASLVLAALPQARKSPEALPRFVNAFSPLALTAVAIMFATGLAGAWINLGGIGALFTTGYGRMLLLKLALVAGAAALGYHNWRTVRPALEAQPRAGLLRMPASLELLTAVAIFLVTGVLVAMPMP
jgi:copper transport protein